MADNIINLDKTIKILNRNNQVEKIVATFKKKARFVSPSQKRVQKKLQKLKAIRYAKKEKKSTKQSFLSPIVMQD